MVGRKNVEEDVGVLMVEMNVGHVVTRVGRSLVRRDLDTKWTVSVVALENVYVSRAGRLLMAILVGEPVTIKTVDGSTNLKFLYNLYIKR